MATHTTTDHDEIRKWAEERGGVPAIVEGTGSGPDDGILRIEFRDSDDLHEVDWDEFFRIFDERGLAFLYEDTTSDGRPSRFNKFVRRENAS